MLRQATHILEAQIGGVQEGVLRKSFLWNGETLDQVLYESVEDDWRAVREEGIREIFSRVVH